MAKWREERTTKDLQRWRRTHLNLATDDDLEALCKGDYIDFWVPGVRPGIPKMYVRRLVRRRLRGGLFFLVQIRGADVKIPRHRIMSVWLGDKSKDRLDWIKMGYGHGTVPDRYYQPSSERAWRLRYYTRKQGLGELVVV